MSILSFASTYENADSLILLTDTGAESLYTEFSFLHLHLHLQSNQSFMADTQLVVTDKAPGNRFVFAGIPHKSHFPYLDIRYVQRIARNALRMAISAGSVRPHILLRFSKFACSQTCLIKPIALALLQEAYNTRTQFQLADKKYAVDGIVFVSEEEGKDVSDEKVDNTCKKRKSECSVSSNNKQVSKYQFCKCNNGISSVCIQQPDLLINDLNAIEVGKSLAREISFGDPQYMSPMNCANAIKEAFAGIENVSIELISEENTLKTEYPLLYAVSRASLHTPEHLPCVVKILYNSDYKDDSPVFFVGKGITYDTGGADLKVSGAMRGMSRDKCGAASIAGAMLSIAKRKVSRNVTAYLAFVRNSIGSDSYVSDELIKARSGKIVRVGNTDAEGRMVMTDLVCEARERSCENETPVIITCATLTGHVCRALGISAAIVPNYVSLTHDLPQQLLKIGSSLGELFEISQVKEEDFTFIQGNSTCCDFHSANSLPSTMTNRGHQYPGAFLIGASGLLDGKGSENVSFMHLDIAAVSEEGEYLGKPTAFPVASLYDFVQSH